MTESENKKLDEIHEDIRAIKQCLKGYNGNPGLLKEFETHLEDDKAFRESFNSFKTRTFILMALIVGGSGAAGAGITRFLVG